MAEEDVGGRDASSHDGVGEGDGGLQLDQGDVVTVEVARQLQTWHRLQLPAVCAVCVTVCFTG